MQANDSEAFRGVRGNRCKEIRNPPGVGKYEAVSVGEPYPGGRSLTSSTPSVIFIISTNGSGKFGRSMTTSFAFGGVHPDDPGCVDEFGRMVKDYRLSGMKLVPCMQHFFLNDRRLFPVYEQAEAYGIPLLVHTGGDPVPGTEIFGHPRDVDEIAEAFPNLTIILAHMGIPFFEETKEILKKHRNVYTDLAFTVSFEDVYAFSGRHGIDAPFLTRDFWRDTVSSLINDFGYERVLYGSDFPFIKPKVALEEFLELDLTDQGKEMIIFKNAKEILKV